MTRKPSESEEEYFARIEFERRKRIEREKQQKLAGEEKKRLRGFQENQFVPSLIVVIRKLRGEGTPDLFVERPRVAVGLFRRCLDHEETPSPPPDLPLAQRHQPAAVSFSHP